MDETWIRSPLQRNWIGPCPCEFIRKGEYSGTFLALGRVHVAQRFPSIISKRPFSLHPVCLIRLRDHQSELPFLLYYLESWAKSFRAAYKALQPSGHGFSFPAVGFLVITISGILFASTRCECALFKRRLVEFESFFRDYVRSFTSKLVEYRFSLPRITRTRQDYPKNTLQVSKNAILLFVVILVGSDKSYLYISLGTLNSKG